MPEEMYNVQRSIAVLQQMTVRVMQTMTCGIEHGDILMFGVCAASCVV